MRLNKRINFYVGVLITIVTCCTLLGAQTSRVSAQASSPQAFTLNVVTFNTQNGFSNSDGRCEAGQRPQAIARYLVENQIDVLFLQETGCTNKLVDLWEDAIDANVDSFESGYINKKLAILSRIPMERNASGAILKIDSSTYAGDRKTQTVRIIKNNQPIRLFNIHPHNFCSEQEPIFSFINQFMQEQVPSIVAGDFNSNTNNFLQCALKIDVQYFRSCAVPDSCPRSTTGNGSVGNNPIDHILVTKTSATHTGGIITSKSLNESGALGGVSDHWPVEASLQFSPKAPATPPTAIRGDFTGDRIVNLFDYNAFLPHFNTVNARYSLVGDSAVDIYDYNELLRLLR